MSEISSHINSLASSNSRTLSIVIVNYNVRFFLDQCLMSVYGSEFSRETELEVWVVDNNSVDGSVEMVREKYPQVHLIANNDNPGFAKANNQALRQAKGDYLLLLNPDTVVEKDTLEKCLAFMQEHRDCGGLGVKMINGEGTFLKESKRGFPTPRTSFFKISGLIKLFPKHPVIGAYYMGHLDDNETNEIEILPGAFIMMSRESFEKVGLLDESYFMYGEDIDYSWRIRLAGYKNYYLPSARIIHYKGESTRKGSMNYVYTFYNAMVIFTKRYFSGNSAKLYIGLINVAIWLRASLSWLKRILSGIALPAADLLFSWGGMVAIKQLWATYWAENVNYYPAVYTWTILPLYAAILMLCSWLYGGYDKPIKRSRLIKGMAVGAAALLVFYSLLDETQRYSRAVLLLGSAWSIAASLGIRQVLGWMKAEGFANGRQHKSTLIVGSKDECQRIDQLYRELGIESEEMVYVQPTETSKISDMIRIYKADEVIFCSKDMLIEDTINLMLHLKPQGVEFKIAPEESDFVIGSNAINSREDLYTMEINTVASPMSRRNKRLFDIGTSLLLILASPVTIWMQHNISRYFRDCLSVLIGTKTWVNVAGGIFTPSDILPGRPLDEQRMNLRYTRNYKVSTDAIILWRNIRNI